MGAYIIGITGASGSIYGVRLAEELLKCGSNVHMIITGAGQQVLEYETGYSIDKMEAGFHMYRDRLYIHEIDNLFAPIASGSFKTDGMVVAPCSMSTLGRISNGISLNLLDRAADVCLKERRKLIVVPRETPLSPIHLKNMLSLSEAGGIILPAMPGFYNKPSSMEDMINFVVGRILEQLGIENKLYQKWGI